MTRVSVISRALYLRHLRNLRMIGLLRLMQTFDVTEIAI